MWAIAIHQAELEVFWRDSSTRTYWTRSGGVRCGCWLTTCSHGPCPDDFDDLKVGKGWKWPCCKKHVSGFVSRFGALKPLCSEHAIIDGILTNWVFQIWVEIPSTLGTSITIPNKHVIFSNGEETTWSICSPAARWTNWSPASSSERTARQQSHIRSKHTKTVPRYWLLRFSFSLVITSGNRNHKELAIFHCWGLVCQRISWQFHLWVLTYHIYILIYSIHLSESLYFVTQNGKL